MTAGVPVVWVVYPDDETVDVHRPGRQVESCAGPSELAVEALPGFRCAAAALFALPGAGRPPAA